MTIEEARVILHNAYGSTKEGAEQQCFGDCCLRDRDKEALLTLIYAEEN